MKSSISFLVLSVCFYTTPAWTQAIGSTGQTSPTTPTQSPSTAPSTSTPSTTGGLKVRGPEAVAQRDPNRVVATIGGKAVTAKQALDLLNSLPPQDRKRFENNLADVLQRIYLEEQLADDAAKLNLDQQSPWKEQLQMARANILTQAYLNKMATSSTGNGATDAQQYYDSHPGDFDQVKLSGIFVAFNPPGTPAASNTISRTETEASAKANDVYKKLQGGGDFGALARSESDNQQTASKGGDLGTLVLAQANIPPDVKASIEKLKVGEISQPVRMPNGFYIFKLENRTKLPFDQVRAQIVQKLQSDRGQQIVKQEMDKYKIQVQDPDFFASTAPAPTGPSLRRPGDATSTTPTATAPAASKPPAK